MSILPIALAAVGVTIAFSFILAGVLRQRATAAELPPAAQGAAASRRTSEMLCPRCHAAMRSGLTMAERGIAWLDADKKIPGRMSLAWYRGLLPNTVNRGLALKLNTAWKCDRCSTLLIDFSSLHKPAGEKG